MTTAGTPQGPEVAPDVAAAFDALRHVSEDAAQALVDTSTSTALATTLDDAESVKAAAAATYAKAHHARTAVAAARKDAEAAIEAQRRALEALLAEHAALLEPLAEQMANAQNVIGAINLYLGRDEAIVRLAEGATAPQSAPIVVRQQVLAMDEESGLRAATGGIDVTSIKEFDAWVTADPAHLNQMLPEPRGVVAIMARRAWVDYGDPWLSARINKANHETWWLIRNGHNVYRMVTDLNVGARLVPARDEFTSIFIDRHTGHPLDPGSSAWIKAEKAAGAREQHFMRIALVLQGLIDRTAVFHPLPITGLSLLAPEHYDQGHVVLLADDENTITSGRTPFRKWLRGKNAALSPGMRVLIATRHRDWPGADKRGYHPRLHPATSVAPASDEPHTITRRGSTPGSLAFTFERHQKIWAETPTSYDTRRPKTRGSCWIMPDDTFILPIDLVTIEEMRDYLDARTERSAYADMFPTLRTAIEFKEAEAQQEAPFRNLLAAQAAQAHGLDVDQAAAGVTPLIHWWKIGNRWHRALSGAPEAEARAARAILTEFARRHRAATAAGDDTAHLNALRTQHPDALLIARRTNGQYVVLTPQPRRWVNPTDKTSNPYNTQIVPTDVYLTQHEYTPGGKHRTTTEWALPAPAAVARWAPLVTTPAWEQWNRRAQASHHLTDPEIEQAISALLQVEPSPTDSSPAHPWTPLAIAYSEVGPEWDDDARTFRVFYHRTPQPIGERPLTAPAHRESAGVAYVRWSRDGRQVALQGRVRVRAWGHWERTPDGGLRGPWERDNTQFLIVHTDPAARAAAEARERSRNEADATWDTLRAEARILGQALRTSAQDAAREAAHARFLDDYRDESLWPAHAATLTFRTPWAGYAGDLYHGVEECLDHLINRLVEDGHAPYGQTVGEALATLGEPYKHYGTLVTIPADVAALRFPPHNHGEPPGCP